MSAKKSATDAGFRVTSDPYVLKKDNSTVTMRPGNGVIVDHGGRHNKYGSDTPSSTMAKRLK
ncbi:hypothetical protein KXD93_25495 [Mucilaginibacter sp. BJC16-A38]|uniref:hypothetical protein n=1 Tax=Mucilaginibacter phenanthrenivorans TaxID=1234842 RepID=UPI002158141C|nr:hypothetical protein [Mucilaginibacter phenanthrenivorans]MCR8561037.1 hypothetical protein [Mucilaginibacter phenanthrenivorans]